MKRREFLAALTALGATPAWPQTASRPHRIDVHHHVLPPEYMAAIATRRGGPAPQWSAARSLEEMDRAGIATAVLSLVQPGVWFGDVNEGRRLARLSNDFGARLVRDHPGRFGLFTAIPLPDTEGSLREIEHAFDVLKADGIVLMTSFGERWLGDPAFWPVMQELERRKAVVYTHPTQASCCRNLMPDVPNSTIEYATDTSRTMASLLFTGTATRFPAIRWIFSHGGGTAPFLLSRFTTLEANMKDRERKLPHGVLRELRRFYYDTAQANHAGALAALMTLVPVSQVLLGTDFPFRRAVEEIAGVTRYGFGAQDVLAIERDNALRLLRNA
jgi:predicted TIM-barrel fold metal-dependent hydrolase